MRIDISPTGLNFKSGGFVEDRSESSTPLIYQVVRKTWLSKKLSPYASVVSALTTLLLVLGSLIYSNNFFEWRSWMAASPELVFEKKEIWRLWTTLFAHADEKHLLSNSFLFFILGTFLNSYFGLITFPFLAFLFGGLINGIVLSTMPSQVQLIGASGIVFWMGGLWLVLFFLIDRSRRLTYRFLRSIGVGLILFVPAEAFDPQISYKSHLYGFFLGVLWAFIYFYVNKRRFRQAEVIETMIDE